MTIDDASNVLPFVPRSSEPPPFVHVELRLRRTGTLQLNAVDERGDIVTFEFTLTAPVTIADLERLATAWDGWRNTSTAAS